MKETAVTKNVKVGSRSILRLSATLLFAGVLISLVAGLFHPANAPANDHPTVFADYAASVNWTTIHLGQFLGMAGLAGGLVALFSALELNSFLMGLSGSAYLIQGWIIGMEGFSSGNELAIVLSIILNLMWSVWLLVVAWRMAEPQPQTVEQASDD